MCLLRENVQRTFFLNSMCSCLLFTSFPLVKAKILYHCEKDILLNISTRENKILFFVSNDSNELQFTLLTHVCISRSLLKFVLCLACVFFPSLFSPTWDWNIELIVSNFSLINSVNSKVHLKKLKYLLVIFQIIKSLYVRGYHKRNQINFVRESSSIIKRNFYSEKNSRIQFCRNNRDDRVSYRKLIIKTINSTQDYYKLKIKINLENKPILL